MHTMWMRLPQHWLRTLLWSLCLALPLQVASAAGLLACALPAGHHSTAALAVPQLQSEAPAHDTEHIGQAHSQHEHAPLQHAGSSGHEDASPGAHKCGACSTCCTGAALPCSLPALPQAGGDPVQAARSAWFTLSANIAPLERPPRDRQD